MSNKIISAGVLVALVLGVVGLFSGDTTNPVIEVVERVVGTSAGPEHTEHQLFTSSYTSGGPCTASSSAGTASTLTSAEMNPAKECLDFTPQGLDYTLTLAASTTPWYPKRTGEVRTLILRNATGTAGIDVTVSAGTGIVLKRNATSTSYIIPGDTDAEGVMRINFKKQADGDLTAYTEVFQD